MESIPNRRELVSMASDVSLSLLLSRMLDLKHNAVDAGDGNDDASFTITTVDLPGRIIDTDFPLTVDDGLLESELAPDVLMPSQVEQRLLTFMHTVLDELLGQHDGD